VLSSQPAIDRRAVILAISTKTESEARLELNRAPDKALPSGMEIDFTGVVRDFTPQPFYLLLKR
jgi:hypothetical protein